QVLAIEDAQHRVFTMNARHDGHAHVDRAARVGDLQASVLRHAALGYVELGHYLDATDRLSSKLGAVDAAHRGEHSVQAELDRESRRVALQVNVRGAGLERVVQGRVDEAHGRAVVLADVVQAQHFSARR